MTSTHPTRRRRLGPAVAAVLSATLGAGTLAGAPAATAAPATGFAAADEPASIPADHWVLGGGEEGFFSVDGGSYGGQDPTFGRLTWTRYADNAKKEYDLIGTESRPMVSGDVGAVVRYDEKTVVLLDAAEGTSTTLELDGYTYTINPLKIVGKGLLAATDTGAVRYYTAAGGSRTVTGLPGTYAYPQVEASTDSHAVVRTKDGTGAFVWALVDLAAAKVVRTYPVPPGAENLALSETRMAWAERRADGTAWAVVQDRATGRSTSVPLGPYDDNQDVQVALAGDWLLTGRPGGIDTNVPSELHALTARKVSATGAVGPAVRLLDHFEDAVAFEDFNPLGLVVRGGSVAAGEGVYRIVPGADGVPRAVLEATTGEPTGVRTGSTVLPHQGETLRPDAVPGGAPTRFAFTVNRCDVKADAVLRHSSGKTLHKTWNAATRPNPWEPCSGRATFDWEHYLDAGTDRYAGAPGGRYTATFTFTPMNGIGTAATVSGGFTVERAEGQHDFDRNADPDFFARDASGVLWTDSTVMTNKGELNAPTRRIGGGWQAYDRIESAGGQTLVARDRTGVLWYYPGDGNGGTGARRSVGGGWQAYDKLAGGSDLNGDGRADLLAADKAGVLWYYKGTGNSAAPFTGKTRIGGGWGKFNQLTAVGDLAGGTGGDLLARDKDGVLWLYLGKGDGTFTAPTAIGGGWNAYTELVAGGDANHNGEADLFAYDARERKVYFYGGTGDRARPFVTKRATTVFSGNAYDHLA